MLAGEMEHMYVAPGSSSQWIGQQAVPSMPAQQTKSEEQEALKIEALLSGQPGPQESSTSAAATMSDQMLQLLEKLKQSS